MNSVVIGDIGKEAMMLAGRVACDVYSGINNPSTYLIILKQMFSLVTLSLSFFVNDYLFSKIMRAAKASYISYLANSKK